MSAVRLALLTEIPVPFRTPLFNALAAREDAELRVLYLALDDPRRSYAPQEAASRFAWEVLPGRGLRRGMTWVVLSRGVGRALGRFGPDVVVVGGWNQPAFWRALAWGRRNGRPVVAWVESTTRDERSGAAPLEAAKRRFLERCSAFLVPGRASAGYLHALGVAEGRIAVAPNAVDLGLFGARVAETRHRREALRGELGLRRCTVLFVGRLSPEKGADLLVRAMRELPADLVVVGDGPEEAELRAAAGGNVRFVGRLQPEELVPWYAAADVLAVPSRSDPWNMTLNEGALAGLPIVASEAPGAAWDLVEDGVSGFRVPAGDEQALALALRRLVDDEPFRAAAGARSRELAAVLTPEAWAEGVAALAARLARR